jgi:peptidoglycan/LPS O-acetylase OafA/YrhL
MNGNNRRSSRHQKEVNAMARTPDESVRRPDLDGLRGVAVLLIIFLHYVTTSGNYPYLGPRPVALFLQSFWSGVDIFFVLSGFLIGGIILDNGAAENFFGVFYLRRALRILPVAYLTIAFAYLVIPLFNATLLSLSQVPPYSYLLFINNFWTANGLDFYPPLGPMWSLAIEEQFYLMAPAFILLAGKRVRNITLLAIVVVSPLLRLRGLHFSPWDFTFFRLDGFSAGMLVAVLLRSARFCGFAARSRTIINAAVISVVLATLVFDITPSYPPGERIAVGISLNSLSAAGVILFLHLNRNSSLSHGLSWSWLVAVGRVSYFLYLMHLPILMCVATLPCPRWLQAVLGFGICLLCAWASWRFLESPLIHLGRRFAYRRPALMPALEPGVAIGLQDAGPDAPGRS